MKCLICRNGATRPGSATVTLERSGLTLVVKSVPANVCDNCGEEYADQSTAERLVALVDEAARAGVQIDVREYLAA